MFETLRLFLQEARDADKDGVQDRYMSGLTDKEKSERRKEIEKNKKKDDSDPSAYDPSNWKTDENKKTKPSQHTKAYHKKYDESAEFSLASVINEAAQNKGLKNKAEKSGISYSTLKKVYDRGVAAWKTGHRPGTTPEQWGMARVNAFITKSKKKLNHDRDLIDAK